MTVDTIIGKITANKDVLNDICIAFSKSEETYNSNGRTWLANRAERISFEIYDALSNVGYYDSVRR